jgi:hypothetical protein
MGVRVRAVLVLVIVVAVAGFAVVSARRLGIQRPPGGALAEGLAQRTVRLMETEFRDRTAAAGEPVACAARPFGVRPDRVARAEDATMIYAWVYCRALPSSGPGRVLSAPVALRLDGPAAVRVPDSARADDRSLQRIFPADVRPALERTRHHDLRTAVNRRLG